LILSDEVLLQIRLVSDDLDGVTLRELADVLIALMRLLIAMLLFVATVVRFMLSMLGWPRRVWIAFWSAIAEKCLFHSNLRWG